MNLTVEQFVEDYKRQFVNSYAFSYKEGTDRQKYHALGRLIRHYLSDNWGRCRADYKKNKVKQMYYFSMEFLPGRQLKNNVYNLGILDTVKKGLAELGIKFEDLEVAEPDPGLGNGGLGRLASCFMDSLAALGVPGHGNGIRYRYGLFEQKFVDGYQVELPDNWLRQKNIWEIRNDQSSCIVRFGGNVWLEETDHGRFEPRYENTTNVLAVPYDTPAVGCGNEIINTIRLWSAEIPEDEEYKYRTLEERQTIDEITQVLYPDDSNYEGLRLRLKQEYFMVSAGVQSIVRHFRQYNVPRISMPEYIAIHINDTHPALVVPELMRILMDEEHLRWESAWAVTQKVCSYTNHTVLAEALEKWPQDLMRELLPRIYMIIEEINRRHWKKVSRLYGENLAYETAILKDGQVHMANLAIIGSHSVNGVARLHTEILKNDVLAPFYELYPNRFNNKTNGITHRRWIQLANPKLSALLDRTIGEKWRVSPSEMMVFKGKAKDKKLQKAVQQVKRENKQAFANYVKETYDIEISPDAIFDVQIKRLHAYKRQHLNMLHILHRYLEIKTNPDVDYEPRVFIFGAKAAPSYTYAKEIIKTINELARVINNDPDIGDRMKVVFVENYGVSLAEMIIPAADVGEQISLAGKEASGTSNMKLMSNGALTIATLDGANVEINSLIGDEHMFLFGMTAEEVEESRGNYDPKSLYQNDQLIKRVMDALVDGKTLPRAQEEAREIFNSLVHYGDEYFVLKDFRSYIEAHERIDRTYRDQSQWTESVIINIAMSAAFSADFTIKQYCEEIWHLHSQAEPGKGAQLVDREQLLK